MKLAKAGQSVNMSLGRKKSSPKSDPGFSSLTVTLAWTTKADFDLCAVYLTKGNEYGIVYFDDLGSQNQFPYIQLSGDENPEEDEDAEEEMIISRLDDMKYVWIFCWDYGEPGDKKKGTPDVGGVCEGVPAKFSEGGVTLLIEDDQGKEYPLALDEECADGNVVLMATIDNSGDDVKLINESNSTLIHGLDNLEQLVALTR